MKLWRPSDGPEYFGLALYCKNNVWAGVCDDSFTCHTARLFCQKLGFPGAMGKYLMKVAMSLVSVIDYNLIIQEHVQKVTGDCSTIPTLELIIMLGRVTLATRHSLHAATVIIQTVIIIMISLVLFAILNIKVSKPVLI